MNIADAQARPQNIARGVILIVATAFTISSQDIVFKIFSTNLSLWQIFTVRALLAFPLLFALAWWYGIHKGVLRNALQKWPLLRSFFLTMTFMAFYAAIAFLSLSTVGAANYIAPIFVTLLSAYVISEPVGLRGWIAVFIGFAGVLILLQPGTDAFSPWAILPVIGAGFYALAHITTRTKCQSVPLPTMAMSLNIVMLTAGLVMSGLLLVWRPGEDLVQAYPNVFGGWSPLAFSDWMVLALLAVLVVVIGMMLAGAYQVAPPSTVATFEYSYLVFAALWDLLFFATTPTLAGFTGMAMIVGAGLMVLRRK